MADFLILFYYVEFELLVKIFKVLKTDVSGTCKPGVCNDTSPNASMGSTNLNMSGSETNSSNFLDSEPARISDYFVIYLLLPRTCQ